VVETTRSRAILWGLVVAATLAVLASIPFDLLPWLRGPAPSPPEWQWGFRPAGPARPLVGGAACGLGAIGLLIASGTAWARRRPRVAGGWLVAGAVALGSIMPITLLGRAPGGALRMLLVRTRSPSYTSYYTVATSEAARDPLSFLRHHDELLPGFARTAKHAATHLPVAASALMVLGAAGTASARALVVRAGLAGALGGVALLTPYGSVAFLAIGGLAAVAGATRGEVGRTWIPVMPILLAGALAGDQGREVGVGPSVVLGSLAAASTLTIAAYWNL
jgi:hypothetical protein